MVSTVPGSCRSRIGWRWWLKASWGNRLGKLFEFCLSSGRDFQLNILVLCGQQKRLRDRSSVLSLQSSGLLRFNCGGLADEGYEARTQRVGERMVSESLLETNVLILNRFFMAVRVIDVRRAFTLLCRDCAEVIEMEDGTPFQSYDFESWCELSELTAMDKQPGEEYLKTVRLELRVPRILRLTRFEKMPTQTVRFNRKNLFARDDNTCQYCGKQGSSSQLSMDHVIPRAHGGRTSWDNIVCCCLRCNGRKGGRTPKEANMKLLRQPGKPKVNPLMEQSIEDPRYTCWRTFLPAGGKS